MQNIAGILWCKVTALGRFAAGVTDVATLLLPPPPRPLHDLSCSPHELLQIAPAHLTLTSVASVLVTMALGPLVTALFARAFLGRRQTRRTWAAPSR